MRTRAGARPKGNASRCCPLRPGEIKQPWYKSQSCNMSQSCILLFHRRAILLRKTCAAVHGVNSSAQTFYRRITIITSAAGLASQRSSARQMSGCGKEEKRFSRK